MECLYKSNTIVVIFVVKTLFNEALNTFLLTVILAMEIFLF